MDYDIEPDEGEEYTEIVEDRDRSFYTAFQFQEPTYLRDMRIKILDYEKKEPLIYASGNSAKIKYVRI